MSILNRLRSLTGHPLNRDRKAAALIGYFKWQAGIRPVPGAVVFDWIHGAKFSVAKGEETPTGNVYYGLTEFTDMCFLLHALRALDQFADVGVNLGSYTILACAAVIIELDGHGERYGYDEDKIVGIMAGHGFHSHAYDPFSRALHRLEGRNGESLNTIFIRDEKAMSERLRDGPDIHVHGHRI